MPEIVHHLDTEIRSLHSFDEYEACVELQKATWGATFDDVVSSAMLMVSQKVGGIVGGAFDRTRHLVGTVYGLTGLRNGRAVHWSHMLAIRKERQNSGLGRALKLFQRQLALDMGIQVMYWTFDPLESRNAHFNLNRLGARVDEYARDLYGSGANSPLHSGIGTDRFIARWDLNATWVQQAVDGTRPPLPPNFNEAPLVASEAHPGATIQPAEAPLVDAPVVRIEIPTNIQALKATTLDVATQWRATTRRAFMHYLARGYTVAGFHHNAATHRSFYVLTASP